MKLILVACYPNTDTRFNPVSHSHRRCQIVQARNLASRRGARYLSAEDLIFLIRHDRAKVNRLRTYLSWKDVRKHAKDSGGDGNAMEVETLEDGADGELSRDSRWYLHYLVLTLLR